MSLAVVTGPRPYLDSAYFIFCYRAVVASRPAIKDSPMTRNLIYNHLHRIAITYPNTAIIDPNPYSQYSQNPTGIVYSHVF